MVAALTQSGFEVKPALRAMFTSPAFYSDQARFALIKSPAELVVETCRTLQQVPTAPEDVALSNRLKAMNQELFQPPNVRGWVGGDNWITAATLYTRYNTCSSAINGTLQKTDGSGGGGKANAKKGRAKGTVRLPPASPEAVAPSTLFTSLGLAPQPEQVVDAAVDRLLQRPLPPDKRAALVDFIGTEPLKLGDAQSDSRVRQMLCLLLSTPEYQLH